MQRFRNVVYVAKLTAIMSKCGSKQEFEGCGYPSITSEWLLSYGKRDRGR